MIVYPLGSRRLTSDYDVQMMLDFNMEIVTPDPVTGELTWGKSGLHFLTGRIAYLREAIATHPSTLPFRASLDHTLDINFYPSTFLNFCWQNSGVKCMGTTTVPGFYMIDNFKFVPGEPPQHVSKEECDLIQNDENQNPVVAHGDELISTTKLAGMRSSQSAAARAADVDGDGIVDESEALAFVQPCLNLILPLLPYPEETFAEDIARLDFTFPQTNLDAYYDHYESDIGPVVVRWAELFQAERLNLDMASVFHETKLQQNAMHLFEANYLGPEMYYGAGTIYFVVGYMQLLNGDLSKMRRMGGGSTTLRNFRLAACTAYVENAIHAVYWGYAKDRKEIKYTKRSLTAMQFLLNGNTSRTHPNYIDVGTKCDEDLLVSSPYWGMCKKKFYQAVRRAHQIQQTRTRQFIGERYKQDEYAFGGIEAEGGFLDSLLRLRKNSYDDKDYLKAICKHEQSGTYDGGGTIVGGAYDGSWAADPQIRALKIELTYAACMQWLTLHNWATYLIRNETKHVCKHKDWGETRALKSTYRASAGSPGVSPEFSRVLPT